MEFVHLTRQDEKYKKEAISLLQENFNCYNNYSEAKSEVEELTSPDRICIGLIEDGSLIGLIGGINMYNGLAYELHPLVIKKSHQRKGYGSKLIAVFEREVHKHGGITIYLGSDDEDNQTSLFGEDLYVDLFDKLKNIKNKNDHPFTFYQKNGYKIVGVIPDANGMGKPDIMMAKRVGL